MAPPKVLMVAEKPSIALSIASALSRGQMHSRKGTTEVHEFEEMFLGFPAHYKVTSVFGHVFRVCYPQSMDLSFGPADWATTDPIDLFQAPIRKAESNPKVIKPRSSWLQAHICRHLSQEARGCSHLVLWLDCDREGENICFEVIQCTGFQANDARRRVHRARFSSITERDILKAMNCLVEPNKDEALAVDARQEIDLKVGVAFTRYQTSYFQGKYGNLDSRVISNSILQSKICELIEDLNSVHKLDGVGGFADMIALTINRKVTDIWMWMSCTEYYDRYLQITTFKPEKFWALHPHIMVDGYELQLEWERQRLFDFDVALMFQKLVLQDRILEVTEISEKHESKGRPPGLNTVNLLKIASSALGFGPQLAMQLAERLYTQGFISYPRTESTAYPPSFDFKGTLVALANNPMWGNYVQGLLSDSYHKPRSGTDAGDHPPITPMRPANEDMLGKDAWRLYQYVCQHFMGTVSPDCKYIRIGLNGWMRDELSATQLVKDTESPYSFIVSLSYTGLKHNEPRPGHCAQLNSLLTHNTGYKGYGTQIFVNAHILGTGAGYEIVLESAYWGSSIMYSLIETKVEFSVGGEFFHCIGLRVTVKGFTSIMPWLAVIEKNLPRFAKGDKIEVSNVELFEGQTVPPDYLSESELISLMEKNGIGTDASISVHINNICERNYVQVQTGRKLVPTTLGITLIRGYQFIDPDLCLPDIRGFIEQQITLVAKGEADHSRVVQHVLEQFKQKYSYFVKQIDHMDALFEAQFSPLADSGRALSKCGKCLRYMKYISSQPSRLYCGTCEEVYYLPQKGTIKKDANGEPVVVLTELVVLATQSLSLSCLVLLALYKELTCPLDNFELLIFSMAGPEGKSFPLCPFCYNSPPFEGIDTLFGVSKTSSSGKLGKGTGMPCFLCPHPTCRHSLIAQGVCACPECNGMLVLDPVSAPKWRLNCNMCNCLVLLPQGAHRIATTRKRCPECDSAIIEVDFNKNTTPLGDGATLHVGCILCDDLLHSLVEVKHGKSFFKRAGKLGRARGAGRAAYRGRGRGLGKMDPKMSFRDF
ncbi:unnamed protein product [Dovyalis caffra]|uniref:DNA topoisomerase n=1 Tax=Dovyalis caffra TaxID=77055 RepID=A0AAV1SBV2_9ROSI|nr:unnamed protein product [Dovyalis caffra]